MTPPGRGGRPSPDWPVLAWLLLYASATLLAISVVLTALIIAVYLAAELLP